MRAQRLLADSAEMVIVDAVNMGEDADTVGAVTGAVASARFGASTLPDRWLTAVSSADELRMLGAYLAEKDPTVDEEQCTTACKQLPK